MKYIIVANQKPIVIGRYGENEETTVQFSINAFFPDLANAEFGLVHQRHGDVAPYPCSIANLNGSINWVIGSGDLARVGSGIAQLTAYKDGIVAKTVLFTTVTLDSMGTVDPPDPVKLWVDEVLRAGLLASDSAERAQTYANTAKEYSDNISEEIEAALTAAKESGEFDGPQGDPGFSPTVQVEEEIDGHLVTITDSTGDTSFLVPDGDPGSPGPAGPGVPEGGTTGQVLTKASDDDYDTEWQDPQGGGGGTGPSPYTSNPAALGTASPGSSDAYSRGDHVHPKPSAADIGAYSKPSGGIPASDLASAVQTSLGKADTALQSYTETDPTVPSWAKASSKPSYTASEVGAIAAPSSPATGAFLVYNGSAWVAQTLSTWQASSY